MSQGLSKGDKAGWNTPSGRPGRSAMDHVADSARASRHAKPTATKSARPAGRAAPRGRSR